MAKAKRKSKQPARRRQKTTARTASGRQGSTAKRAARKTAKKRAAASARKKPAVKRGSKQTKKKTSMPRSTNMVVVTSGERPLQEVADDLRRAGFQVEQTLDAIGQLTGRAAPGAKSRLAKVRGVTDVSAEHPPFNIAPPDAPVQ